MINVTQLQCEYGRSRVDDDFSLTHAQPGVYDWFGHNDSDGLSHAPITEGA
ncbi:hypothetical protein [Undibacterium sp. TS12]|uniref:hypothetical protein n=1 Tax=Undibacterium sp. TS12 TaxID=2908202 RepID=UPI001F4C6C86|nr:hypothetical protein [Undibacterium sp. TS12]MCH8618161.1 hypothetical protein [Undibacterium sp. TS12]